MSGAIAVVSKNNQDAQRRNIVDVSMGGKQKTLDELKDMNDYDDEIVWAKWNDKAPAGLVRQ